MFTSQLLEGPEDLPLLRTDVARIQLPDNLVHFYPGIVDGGSR